MDKKYADALAKHLSTLAYDNAWLRMLDAGVNSVVQNQPTRDQTLQRIENIKKAISTILETKTLP